MTLFLGASLVAFACAEESEGVKFAFSLLIATLPTLFVKRISFFLLACPCLVHDESATSSVVSLCFDCVECCGRIAAVNLCLIGLVALTFGAIIWSSVGASNLWLWFTSVLQTWILWFFITFGVRFNPYRCFELIFCPISFLSCYLFHVGKWRSERKKVLDIITKERGLELEATLAQPI